MSTYRYIPVRGRGLISYAFAVTIVHEDGVWIASCPALLPYGAEVSAKTRQEVLRQINRRAWSIVLKLARSGESIPGQAVASEVPLVVVITGV
jgi:predicted RNase H-like HicB family nuclease